MSDLGMSSSDVLLSWERGGTQVCRRAKPLMPSERGQKESGGKAQWSALAPLLPLFSEGVPAVFLPVLLAESRLFPLCTMAFVAPPLERSRQPFQTPLPSLSTASRVLVQGLAPLSAEAEAHLECVAAWQGPSVCSLQQRQMEGFPAREPETERDAFQASTFAAACLNGKTGRYQAGGSHAVGSHWLPCLPPPPPVCSCLP